MIQPSLASSLVGIPWGHGADVELLTGTDKRCALAVQFELLAAENQPCFTKGGVYETSRGSCRLSCVCCCCLRRRDNRYIKRCRRKGYWSLCGYGSYRRNALWVGLLSSAHGLTAGPSWVPRTRESILRARRARRCLYGCFGRRWPSGPTGNEATRRTVGRRASWRSACAVRGI